MKNQVFILCAIFVFIAPAIACDTNEIEIDGNCIESKFSLTTSETDIFKFTMTANGTFYVDCGNGGTLDSDAGYVSGNTITRANTVKATYTCNWGASAPQTIRFAGRATGYINTTQDIATIAFYIATDGTQDKIVAIDGSLGAIFPTLGQNDGQQPRFTKTFQNTKIKRIPNDLFSNINGSTLYMFSGTFWDCTALTEIPENLFRNITANKFLFLNTFYGCTGLTTVPTNLFNNITKAQTWMFAATFGSTGLKSVPDGLFANVHGGADRMFYYTFGYTNIESIPENLFRNINTAASDMFSQTFFGCKNLSGYIPPSTFAGLIENGSPTATDMWTRTFSGTKLATSCPPGMVEFNTGYESEWDGYVSCVAENLTCDAGRYLPANGYQCKACSDNSYCVGGTYSFNETTDQGIQSCATGYSSVAGSSSCTANIITIIWDGVDAADITANNAGTVTYGGDIRTPKKARHINGKIFTGWTFNAPQ